MKNEGKQINIYSLLSFEMATFTKAKEDNEQNLHGTT